MNGRVDARRIVLYVLLLWVAGFSIDRGGANIAAATSDVVLNASDVTAMRGNWSITSDGTAAGGQTMASVDRGWSTTNAPQASPADYFEATFSASGSVSY